MICVGIDVAKDKHDCFILRSEGEVLAEVCTPNNAKGFDTLLHTNLYRKSLSLRKTKTDRMDARTIYRFDKVRERAKLKQSVSRLVTILFPKLEKLAPTLHMAPVYVLLSLKAVLSEASQGRYGREKAIEIRKATQKSIGSSMPAKSLELKYTIQLICELDNEIEEIEKEIDAIVDTMDSPITSIPGIGKRMGAMILAEIGDFSKFESPDKILAYPGMSPSIYQSGQLTQFTVANSHSYPKLFSVSIASITIQPIVLLEKISTHSLPSIITEGVAVRYT